MRQLRYAAAVALATAVLAGTHAAAGDGGHGTTRHRTVATDIGPTHH